jgi:hypothetical protein
LWGRLDALPNSLKRRWRQFTVEKLTFNSLATTLVDISANCMLPQNLRHVAFCLCDKTAHLSGILLYTAQGAPV